MVAASFKDGWVFVEDAFSPATSPNRIAPPSEANNVKANTRASR